MLELEHVQRLSKAQEDEQILTLRSAVHKYVYLFLMDSCLLIDSFIGFSEECNKIDQLLQRRRLRMPHLYVRKSGRQRFIKFLG